MSNFDHRTAQRRKPGRIARHLRRSFGTARIEYPHDILTDAARRRARTKYPRTAGEIMQAEQRGRDSADLKCNKCDVLCELGGYAKGDDCPHCDGRLVEK